MTSNDCKTDWEEALNSLPADWEVELVRRRVKAAIQEARAPIQITEEMEREATNEIARLLSGIERRRVRC